MAYFLMGRAFLVTYQGDELGLDEFKELQFWDQILEYSWCVEKGNRRHTHLYIVTKEKQEYVDIEVFEMKGKKPHIEAGTSRGRSARRTWDRVRFYVYCIFKNTSIRSATNYMPMQKYAVERPWIMALWRQGKLDEPVKCAATYRVLTPTMEAQVNLVNKRNTSYARENVLDERSRKLMKHMIKFKSIAEVETWKYTFDDVEHRYTFVWLHGPSGNGKTMFALNIKKMTHLHSAGVDWGSYDASQHDAIVFDDVYDIETYINMHKPIFQAARKTAVNMSKTNCFAMSLRVGWAHPLGHAYLK
jgi:hypothetical protein